MGRRILSEGWLKRHDGSSGGWGIFILRGGGEAVIQFAESFTKRVPNKVAIGLAFAGVGHFRAVKIEPLFSSDGL